MELEFSVAGEPWREYNCEAETDIAALMEKHSITSLTCDTPEGMLRVRQH